MNKAVGHDDLLFFYLFIKIAADIVAPYLQYFFEFSFPSSIFPESCSFAKIIPLHRKGDKTIPDIYRPISILTCFSKILERLIYNRFLELFKMHNVIYKTPYGFQKHISIYRPCLFRYCNIYSRKHQSKPI